MTKSRAHVVAAIVGLTLITLFFTSSVVVELFGDEHAVTTVKTTIAFALLVLVPSMVVTGATGRALGKGSRSPIILRKQRRMIAVALIGVLVLVPCALVLQRLASGGDFGTTFAFLQGVELVGGAVNIVLMSLNIRTGRQLTAGRRKNRVKAATGQP